MPKNQDYSVNRVTYQVTKGFRSEFLQACNDQNKKPSKLKRNWAINFMETNDPNGKGLKEFKLQKVEISGDEIINDQVYFPSMELKTRFVEYCDKNSISLGDFFRTCEYNFIKTGDPTGKI
ncbi:MAG: hypothetical protein GX163_04910 [Bacteroidetes bacterium]|nr:hypothetical protein [Bacteroidota bacterium]